MNHLFYTSITHNLEDILMRKREKLISLFLGLIVGKYVSWHRLLNIICFMLKLCISSFSFVLLAKIRLAARLPITVSERSVIISSVSKMRRQVCCFNVITIKK